MYEFLLTRKPKTSSEQSNKNAKFSKDYIMKHFSLSTFSHIFIWVSDHPRLLCIALLIIVIGRAYIASNIGDYIIALTILFGYFRIKTKLVEIVIIIILINYVDIYFSLLMIFLMVCLALWRVRKSALILILILCLIVYIIEIQKLI